MSVLIIAEAGVNHNGDLAIAKRLVNAARAAGVDIVKFQTFRAESLLRKGTEKAEYQKKTSAASESQYDMIKRLELNEREHIELIRHCDGVGLKFLSTPFDIESIEMLQRLGMNIWKIPSGEITNLPYLRMVGGMRQKTILSTGMATLGEVEAAICALEASGTPRSRITVLHCTTEYPAPYAEVNLKAMRTMAEAFGVEVGYSDHTQGITIPIAAAAMGASVIEKHFTLDRNMEGPDHKASLEPDELKNMVEAIRNVESALGDGLKRPGPSEFRNISIARKSIVAARCIAKGEVLTEGDMTVKRPGGGISPMRWDEVVGKKATRDYEADDMIQE